MSVKCGQCELIHESVADVRECYTAARGGYLSIHDAEEASAAEIAAEAAYERFLEEGPHGPVYDIRESSLWPPGL